MPTKRIDRHRKRERQIAFTVTEVEKALIYQVARDRKISMPDLVRSLVLPVCAPPVETREGVR